MEFTRVMIAMGIFIGIGVFVQLMLGRILKFYDKNLPCPILRKGSFDKFGIFDGSIELTYEGRVLVYIPFIIIAFPLLFLSESNYFFNLGLYLLMVLPGVMLLFRINTFSDKNILPETGLGYDPIQSWVLSLLAMMMGLLIGFSGLNFSYIPLYVSLVTIILALISGMIPMFPDYINRFLSYDIRSERGVWLLRKTNAVTIGVQMVAFVLLRHF